MRETSSRASSRSSIAVSRARTPYQLHDVWDHRRTSSSRPESMASNTKELDDLCRSISRTSISTTASISIPKHVRLAMERYPSKELRNTADLARRSSPKRNPSEESYHSSDSSDTLKRSSLDDGETPKIIKKLKKDRLLPIWSYVRSDARHEHDHDYITWRITGRAFNYDIKNIFGVHVQSIHEITSDAEYWLNDIIVEMCIWIGRFAAVAAHDNNLIHPNHIDQACHSFFRTRRIRVADPKVLKDINYRTTMDILEAAGIGLSITKKSAKHLTLILAQLIIDICEKADQITLDWPEQDYVGDDVVISCYRIYDALNEQPDRWIAAVFDRVKLCHLMLY